MDREISVEKLREWLDAGTTLTLLDVREPWETAICRLPGSVLVPLAALPQRVGELPADGPVVVVCHHGIRSANAANWLRRQGRAAINLAGGIDAWARRIDPDMEVY